MARLCNVPLYLCGISTGSYAYTTSSEARADLWNFGVRAYADCITGTLSQNNVLPNGTYVEFDSDDYLEGSYTEDADAGGEVMPPMAMPNDIQSPA